MKTEEIKKILWRNALLKEVLSEQHTENRMIRQIRRFYLLRLLKTV